MTRKELLQARREAIKTGREIPVGRGLVLMHVGNGRIRLTGQGSSYFDTYHEFYRWVQNGALTRWGPLVRIEWSEDHQDCWWA